MYGFISNNLQNQIERYLSQKNIKIDYKYVQQIKSYENIDLSALNSIDTLIIDSSIFYNEQECLKMLFYIRETFLNLRIILISFSKQLLVKAAMIGIYDFIKFEKKKNLENELDNIIIKPNTLSDISEIFNIDIINESDKVMKKSKIIALLGCNQKVYLTSLIISLLSIAEVEEKALLIIFYSDESELEYFSANIIEPTIDNLFKEYNEFKFPIIFINKNFEKEDILKVLLNYSSKYEKLYFDLNVNCLGKLGLLEEYISSYWILDRKDIISGKNESTKKTLEIIDKEKISKKLNVKDIYIENIEDDIIKNFQYYKVHLETFFPEYFMKKNKNAVKSISKKVKDIIENKKNVFRH